MGDKEKLRFTIQGNAYAYEGVNTPAARQKDLFDFLAKMKIDESKVVPTFRANLPECARVADADITAAFNEALDKRRRKEASKKGGGGGAAATTEAPTLAPPAPPSSSSSAPPVASAAPEQPQKLTLSLGGKVFSYEGLPSQRMQALADLLVKQAMEGPSAVKAFRENFPASDCKTSDNEFLELLEERKRARADRKKGKSLPPATTTTTDGTASTSNATTTAATTTSSSSARGGTTASASPAPAAAPPRESGSVQAADDWVNMSATERASITTFIKEVLDAPTIDIAAAVRTAPTSSSSANAGGSSNANAAEGGGDDGAAHGKDKVSIYCQEGTAATSTKVVYAPKSVTYAELQCTVERKFGKPMTMSFLEGDDKIDIDDDDVLQMFLDQDVKKLRLLVAPASDKKAGVKDDKLTDAAAPAASGGGARKEGTTNEQNFTLAHTEVRSFTGHTAAIYSVAFSPNGEKFVSASRDRSVRVWNVADGTHKIMKGGHNGLALSCAFSPSGEHVVSSSEDTSIKIWNVESGSKVVSLRGHDDKVYCVQYNSTGAYIVSGSCDRTVRVWNADTAAKVAVLRGHSLPVFSCGFSFTDAGRYVVSGSDDRLVKIWDWREGKEVRSLVGHTGTVWSSKFSHDDKLIVSASMDHEIHLWAVDTGSILRSLNGHMTPIHHAIFTKDDKYIFSCARDWSVMVWDVETGRNVDTITGHRNTVFHMDLHGSQLLTCSLDVTVKLWNIKPR